MKAVVDRTQEHEELGVVADLPPAVAEQIAWKNGERLFGALRTALK